MTSNIPESASTDFLASLLNEKAADKIIADLQAERLAEESAGPFNGKDEDTVIAIAESALEAAIHECGHVMTHKVMALLIFQRLISWHEAIAFKDAEENISSAIGWAEDMGKLKVAYEALRNVRITNEDFTCDPNNYSD